MKINLFFLLVLFITQLLGVENWTSFRGPTGMGVTEQKIPTSWAPSSILWKKSIPGEGQSSVVEANDRIFLTASKNFGKQRSLLCFSKDEGKLLWQRTINYKGDESSHRMNGWCTPTPATEGSRVIAFFGPAGMYCFDTDGKKIWELQLGNFPGSWGAAASPVVRNGIVYQNCDSMGPSRLIAISLETGKIIWDTPRIEKPRGGWSTPIFISHNGMPQLVLNGEYGVRGYAQSSGKEIWFCKGFNGRGSPVPFYENGLLYVVNGKPGDLYAVAPSGHGDVTQSHLKWHAKRNGGRDLPSPAVINNMVLVTSMSGIITCYDAKNGKTYWVDRIKGAFSGSPLVSKSYYYLTSESGRTYVVSPNTSKLNIVAKNELSSDNEEIFRSTLSPIENKIYTRSNKNLYCIIKDK
jgi:outer membrane protein assembly factor BamB